ncbi:MAG: hypothetical protein Q9172_001622 [Xanthocarpia lactea]
MKDEGELPRSMPPPRKPSTSRTMFDPVGRVFNRLFSLLVPRDWSRSTLKDIMNNDDRQDELIRTYIDCEIAKMNTTGVTAALIAGVISSGFDWYNIGNTSWVTRAMWFSGLVLAVASVASSAIHTAAFLRMKCERNINERFKQALGNNQTNDKHWHPHALTPYVLGGPTLHLKLAVLAFVIGLFFELWRAAVAAALSWKSDDLKARCPRCSNLRKSLMRLFQIAFIATLVGAFVFVNYIFSVLTLVHNSMHITKKPKV